MLVLSSDISTRMDKFKERLFIGGWDLTKAVCGRALETSRASFQPSVCRVLFADLVRAGTVRAPHRARI
ncbi:hypothetical protein B0H10DRAFT_2054908 [Mycena sp. CBHHK59/15]|nr:hypothetical protein B0H10DRAFT_2054908 [Mycena sp. CBHHK59/15]